MIPVRRRRTRHLNRARLELELRRAVRPTVIVALSCALGIGIAIYIGLQVSGTLGESTYKVRFAVNDVTGVKGGLNDLRIKGIKAGTIEKVELQGGQPYVVAKVRSKYGRIFQDAHATLRPNTPLQDIYLDVVDRGHPAAGRVTEAHPLAAGRTRTSVRVDDVLNVFQPDVRARMRLLLDGLGNGLADRGLSLRTAFVELTPLLKVAGNLSRQLDRRRPMTARLIHNAAVLTGELAQRDTTLRTLVRQGAAALSTLQAGRGDLDATLRVLPQTLSAVRTSFAAVRGITGDVDEALVALRPVADRVEPALADVRKLNGSLSPAVTALGTPVRRLVPLSQSLRPLSANLQLALARLAPQIDTINKVTKTLAVCGDAVNGFFQWDASMVKYGDARGPAPRGNLATGSPASVYAVPACAPGQAIGGRPARESDGR
jgi:ABC-type transporter Mla subunit MlaD